MTMVLKAGKHRNPEEGACFVEAAALLAGESFTDHPECVCPVIAMFGRGFNDRLPSDELRTRLLAPLVPVIVGTRSIPEVERKRAFLAADRAVRVFAPLALEAKGLAEQAARMRALAPVVDRETARAAAAAAAYAADAASAAAAWSAAAVVRAAAYAAYATDAAAARAAAWSADAASCARAYEEATRLIRDMAEIR